VGNFIDYDGEGLKLVQDTWELSKDAQFTRNTQHLRDYKLYSNFIDQADRDPDRPNVFIPKTYSNVEIKTYWTNCLIVVDSLIGRF
jgi:hypothetical protein